jgi:hypothetical protein
MIRARRSACAAHRAALLDFVDHRGRGPATEDALEHLDRCPACEGDLSEIALMVTALRRMQAEVLSIEPPRDAWEHVRSLAARRPVAPWRWRLTLGATVLGTALAAVTVMPTALRQDQAITSDAGPGLPDGLPARTALLSRFYDPPAGSWTAQLVMVLASNDQIDRPRELRALAILPAATDRLEPDPASRQQTQAVELTLSRAATAT